MVTMRNSCNMNEHAEYRVHVGYGAIQLRYGYDTNEHAEYGVHVGYRGSTSYERACKYKATV